MKKKLLYRGVEITFQYEKGYGDFDNLRIKLYAKASYKEVDKDSLDLHTSVILDPYIDLIVDAMKIIVKDFKCKIDQFLGCDILFENAFNIFLSEESKVSNITTN